MPRRRPGRGTSHDTNAHPAVPTAKARAVPTASGDRPRVPVEVWNVDGPEHTLGFRREEILLDDVHYGDHAPQPSFGERRAALEGSVEEWISQAIEQPVNQSANFVDFLCSSTQIKDGLTVKETLKRWASESAEQRSLCSKHLCSFVRNVVALTPGVLSVALGAATSTRQGAHTTLDHAVLMWLWMSTEHLTHGNLLICLRMLMNTWHPCVQISAVSRESLAWSAKKIHGSSVAAGLVNFADYAVGSGQDYHCEEPQIPAQDDVLHESEDSGTDQAS